MLLLTREKNVSHHLYRHIQILIRYTQHLTEFRFLEFVLVLQITVETVNDPKAGVIFDPRSLIQTLADLLSKSTSRTIAGSKWEPDGISSTPARKNKPGSKILFISTLWGITFYQINLDYPFVGFYRIIMPPLIITRI